MKKHITFFLLSLFPLLINAQPYYYWAGAYGSSTDPEYAYAVTTDATGNVYSTGAFRRDIDIDPTSGVTTITSFSGAYDTYIQKMSSSGAFVWGYSFGGIADDIAYDIEVDANGNIYLCGYFADAVDMDPTAGVTTLTAGGQSDFYVLKLNSSAQLQWVKQFGGNNVQAYGMPGSMKLDASGNIYVAGIFNGTVDFDPGTTVQNITSAGAADIFVMKLNSSGDLTWAKTIGSTAGEASPSLAIDGSGNVYLTGNYITTLDFDPSTGSTSLTPAGSSDVYIWKLDASGGFGWVKSLGGTSSDNGRDIEIYGNNLYITGSYKGTVDLDPSSSTTLSYTSLGDFDVFIGAYTISAGDLVWAKSIGKTGTDQGEAISITSTGNVCVSGKFSYTVDFNPDAGINNLSSKGGTDVFTVALDNSGAYVWAYGFGSTSDDEPYDNALGLSNAMVTAGIVNGSFDADPGAGTSTIAYNGAIDAFVHVMSSTLVTATVGQVSEQEYFYPNPASDLLYFSAYENANVRIINSSGQVVLNTTLAGEVLDISSLLPGLYMVEIEKEDFHAGKKIVIE